uniref:Transposase n=1 Tax=Cacopsylla melanoneura TaxID=428564 RepID=A0A8D9DZE8_9HEMI
MSSTLIDMINADRRLLERICFTDESCFTLTHAPNFQNSRVWSKINPNLLVQPHTQYRQKINVWVGILGQHIIGPVFYEENLTGQKILDMLINEIGPRIEEVAENRDIWLQLDGCPAHNTREAREFLQASFPGRLIGTRGDILWAARSPDLAPNDYFLWGYLKSILYVRSEFYDRLGYCVAADGNILEHLI